MPLRICPGCKQNADRDSGFCSLCGYDFSSDRDDAYNRRVVLLWRVVTIAMVIVWVTAIRSMGRRPALHDYGEALILILVPTVVLFGLLKLLFLRSRKNWWLTAMIPSILLTGGVFASRAWQAPDSSLSLSRLLNFDFATKRAALVARAAAVNAAQGASATMPASAPAAAPKRAMFDRPDPADPFATLMPIAEDCFAFMRKQPDFIVSEMKGGGVERMLTPAALEDRKQLAASRARIKKMQDRLADYDARIRKKAAELPAKVNASGAPAKVRESFLAAARQSGGDLVRGLLEYVALNRKTLTTTDQMLEFLRARTDRFTVVNNRPMFGDAADSRKYDELRKQLDGLSDQAERLRRFVRTQAEDAIRELKFGGDSQPAAQGQASAGGS